MVSFLIGLGIGVAGGVVLSILANVYFEESNLNHWSL